MSNSYNICAYMLCLSKPTCETSQQALEMKNWNSTLFDCEFIYISY